MGRQVEVVDLVVPKFPEEKLKTTEKKEESKKKKVSYFKVTGKQEHLETPLEKREKLPTFTEKYEESLKKQLFEEDLKRMASGNGNEDEEESQYFETDRKLEHHKRDGEWDVPLSEEIKYFDPELSYEITGYRPINMTQGLDFDPIPFMETGRIYTTTGSYTEYPAKTKPYNDFWTEQLRRCTEGYTVGKYRITGDHYFFLNFYRMQTVALDAIKDTTGRNESFPSFIAKQYEFFHYIEICEYIGKDVCLLKGRGMGMSEVLADLAVRPFITTRKFRTLLTAATDDQLDPLLDKAWFQLNWLNANTNGGMKRSRQKIDNIRQKRASLLDKEGNERGRYSEIEGIIANNPRKVRGDRVERLVYEEAGSAPTLIKSWIQGTALVELGGKKIGTKIALGTGRKLMSNMNRENKKIILNDAVNEYLKASGKEKSLTKIGNKYKIKRQTLAEELRRRNIEVVNYQNLTTVDETVFDKIDTEEKAYWLGFIFADGNISSTEKKFEINLSVSDLEHLQKLKNFFKGKNIIRTTSTICRYSFRNKNIWENLNKLGCTPNKSLTLKFPEKTIFKNKNLIYDFIRGYCDGDGCLYFNEKTHATNISIVGTLDFLKETAIYLNIETFQIRNKSCKKWPNKAFELRYSGSSARKVARILYENSTIYLTRKFEKFKKFCRFEEESSKAKSSKIGEGCDANPEVIEWMAKGHSTP